VGTFTVPDAVNDGDTIIFAFDIDNPSGSSRDHAIIDNIAVTAIPEPASLALMGLGGLLVATGRRRKA